MYKYHCHSTNMYKYRCQIQEKDKRHLPRSTANVNV